MTAKRVTPMMLVKDVDASVEFYAKLGLIRQETEDPQCIGLVSKDRTGIILLGDRYARSSMPPKAVDVLADKGGLYIWVDDLTDVCDYGEMLGEVRTDYGTQERYVKQDDRLIVYAQNLAA